MKNNFFGLIFLILAFSANLFSYDALTEGQLAYAKKEYKKSFKSFQEAAKQGSGQGYWFLGIQYQYGKGIKQSFDKAIVNYKKGIELGNVNCMDSLAGLYDDVDNNKRPKNYKKAVYWYEKAIQTDKNAANSLIQLGNIYYYGGFGVAQNKNKSYKYWKACSLIDESQLASHSLPQDFLTRCQNNLDILCQESSWACQGENDTNLKDFTRDDSIQVVNNLNNNLMWQDDESAKSVTKNWQGAIEYCQNLNFAGYSDWRVPNLEELKSIVDKNNPSKIKSEFKNTASYFYWSSTPGADYSSTAWYIFFYSGNEYYSDKSGNGNVRCVRDSK